MDVNGWCGVILFLFSLTTDNEQQQQQQPYSSGPQQRQPDHLYVPVPVQLSPSSVILPGPPAAGGASPQYKTQGAPSGLSTSASAQAPYLGPFQAQPQQQQQQHHHQQQHSAPIIPLQPPPLYVRQQQQQQHQQQSAPVAAAVAPPPPQQHSLAPLPPLFPPPLYTRGQSQSSAAPLPIPPPPESFAPLPVPPPPAPSSDSFSYSPEAPVTVPSVGDLHHDLPGAHTHQDDDLLNTNALAALPPPPLPVPGVPAPSGSASGSADESQWTKGSIPWVLESMGMNTLNDLLIMSGEDEVMDKEGKNKTKKSQEAKEPKTVSHCFFIHCLHITFLFFFLTTEYGMKEKRLEGALSLRPYEYETNQGKKKSLSAWFFDSSHDLN